MPLCARCLGVHIGVLAAAGLLVSGAAPGAWICVLLMLPIGLDWGLQRWGRVASSNQRRLFTGLLGGVGYGILWWQAILLACGLLVA